MIRAIICTIPLALAACATGAPPEQPNLTNDRLLRVEDSVADVGEEIASLRERLTDQRFAELAGIFSDAMAEAGREAVDFRNELRAEMRTLHVELREAKEKARMPWWAAMVMAVAVPGAAVGGSRVGRRTRPNGNGSADE